MFRLLLKLVIVFIIFPKAYASSYKYDKIESGSHIIHVVRIDPTSYKIEIIKAKGEIDDNLGRETVSSIASRTNAEIAINGGFFHIGEGKDGKPAGSLVIKGQIYNLTENIQPLLIINLNKLYIGNKNPKNYISKDISLVSGIPLLVSEGSIVESITQKTGEFYTSSHARTALGIKKNGEIVILVAEHKYKRDLYKISMGEVLKFIQEKGELIAARHNHKSPNDITISELKAALRKECQLDGEIGLTILELAQMMKEFECTHAINLDGGGSSTLWIEGRVINKTFSEKDEKSSVQEPFKVGNAIIFKRIKK